MWTQRPEYLTTEPKLIWELQRRVAAGEGSLLEFKKKATYPEKIVQEMIAFANTQGGELLLGVDDDGELVGVKYPDEDLHLLHDALQKFCKPKLDYQFTIIPLSAKRFVVRFQIQQSEKRPHYFVADGHRMSFVRERDMCIKASREMCEIIRRSKSEKGVRFTFGDSEKALLDHLQQNEHITLKEYKTMAGISRHMASRKLVLLSLAKVIRITPTEKGDLFSLA